MKAVFPSRSNSASVDSVMTPMIDVVFLLLIFFLTTASFQRLEKQLPSASAASKDPMGSATEERPPPPEPTAFDDIVIKLSMADGQLQYSLQSQKIGSFAELTTRLQGILKIRSDVPIIVDPSNDVDAGDAIRVYDMVRRNGSLSVFFVAR